MKNRDDKTVYVYRETVTVMYIMLALEDAGVKGAMGKKKRR